jgi:uncharacterized protein (TIGR02246 family)
MRGGFAAIFAIAVAGAGAGQALAAPASEFDAAAHQLAAKFASTWTAADGRGYGEAYWPDAELVDPAGDISDGREAIIQTHVNLWKRGRSRASTTVRRVRPLSARLMVTDITAVICGFAALPPGARPDTKGCVWSNLKHVVEKRGPDWKIVASQNTFLAPPKGR